MDIRRAIEKNNIKKIKEFINKNDLYSDPYITSVFALAVENKNMDVIMLFLDSDFFTDDRKYNFFFTKGCELGITELIEELVLKRNIKFKDNFPFCVAAQNGHIEIVKLLLEKNLADPISTQNYSIRNASYNGHEEIVELLWKEQSVKDTLINNNKKLYETLRKKDVEKNIKSF